MAEALVRDRLELQDLLTKVAATVPGMIFSFRMRDDGSASLPFCTQAIQDLWGLSPEEVREDFSHAFAQIHPKDLERTQNGIAESARTLTPWHNSFRVLHPRKGERWLSGQSMPRMEPDGSTLWHGFVQDVTEHKLGEEAPCLSEERYRNLVETTSDCIWEIDLDGSYTYISPRVRDLLGYSPEEVLGRTVFELMPDQEAVRLRSLLSDLTTTRKSFSALENVGHHKDAPVASSRIRHLHHERR